MPYFPDRPAGPNTHRKMFHWVWNELKLIGTAIEEGGGGQPEFGNWDGGRAPTQGPGDPAVFVFDGGYADGTDIPPP